MTLEEQLDGRDLEKEMAVARQVGFTILMQEHPQLRYLDGNGALSRHGRPATEAEVRMWSLLVGMDYAPWSLSLPSAAQATLHRMEVGMPLEPSDERDASGAEPRETGR